MKNSSFKWILPLLALVTLSGCGPNGKKTLDFSIVYGILAGLALVLFLLCFLSRLHGPWLQLLFGSVAVVNAGYFLLSVTGSLAMAIWANRLSYLGSVFLPLAMLMLILELCHIRPARWRTGSLLILSLLVFLISASYPWLHIYYESIELRFAGGVPVLDKTYGPWHILYLFYLLGYMLAMIWAVAWSWIRKKAGSPAQSLLMCVAVLINIGVWLTEQFFRFDFELLSLSYIISELFLLGLSLVSHENRRLLDEAKTAQKPAPAPVGPEYAEQLAYMKANLPTLTATEQTVYRLYLSGKSSQEIRRELDITENTLKYHNKNIYSKLGISSRKQLLLLGAALEAEN